jgi:pseudaminic acid cytidylyltransferase
MDVKNLQTSRGAHRIAIIPARGGSKRVPRKNVRTLLGKPLIVFTIDAALESGLFDRVIVSTDCEEIARVANEAGAEIPFLRRDDLSDDFTPASLVTVDAVERLDPQGNQYQQVAQLMANCPLRNAEDLRCSLDQFIGSHSDSQISVTRFGWLNPWWAVQRTETFELRPLFEGQVTQRSQDLPELYCPTGAIWWAKADVLRHERTFHIADRTGWEIPWQRGVDIDTEEDWLMAETLMRVSRREATAHGA